MFIYALAVPSSKLDLENKMMRKTDYIPVLMELTVQEERQMLYVALSYFVEKVITSKSKELSGSPRFATN